jgi:hypothetical protein
MDLIVENRLSRVQKYDRNLTIRHRHDIFFEALYACFSSNFVAYSAHRFTNCHLRVSYYLQRN